MIFSLLSCRFWAQSYFIYALQPHTYRILESMLYWLRHIAQLVTREWILPEDGGSLMNTSELTPRDTTDSGCSCNINDHFIFFYVMLDIITPLIHCNGQYEFSVDLNARLKTCLKNTQVVATDSMTGIIFPSRVELFPSSLHPPWLWFPLVIPYSDCDSAFVILHRD
jgi:hypothetical protein